MNLLLCVRLTGKLVYNAQSPDEAALVQAARNFGYVFKVRYIRGGDSPDKRCNVYSIPDMLLETFD